MANTGEPSAPTAPTAPPTDTAPGDFLQQSIMRVGFLLNGVNRELQPPGSGQPVNEEQLRVLRARHRALEDAVQGHMELTRTAVADRHNANRAIHRMVTQFDTLMATSNEIATDLKKLREDLNKLREDLKNPREELREDLRKHRQELREDLNKYREELNAALAQAKKSTSIPDPPSSDGRETTPGSTPDDTLVPVDALQPVAE